MKKLFFSAAIMACLLSRAWGEASPVNSFANLGELLAHKPVSGETAVVLGRYIPSDWGPSRTAKHVPTSTLATNLGNVFMVTNGIAGRWVFDDRFAGYQDPRWFGVVMDPFIDSTTPLQATYDYCTNNVRMNAAYGTMPRVELPDGVIRITRPINFTSPFRFASGMPSAQNVSWSIGGRGIYQTQILVAFTDPADTNYPAIDMSGWANCEMDGFTIFAPSNYSTNAPRCGLLNARIGKNETSGYNNFSRLHIVGKYGTATTISISSEICSWNDCKFLQNGDTNAQYAFLGIGYFLNDRIKSKFVTLYDSEGAGNGLNVFKNCIFRNERGNPLPRVRAEFAQHWLFFNPFFYGGTGGICLQFDQRCEGVTVMNAQHEHHPDDPPERFIEILTRPSTNLFAGQGAFSALTVMNSSIGSIYATNGSILSQLNYFGNRSYSRAWTNVNDALSEVFPALDVYNLLDSRVAYGATMTNYAEPYRATFTVRNESRDNVWQLASNSVAFIAKGGNRDYPNKRNQDVMPLYNPYELGGLDFGAATDNATHIATPLVASSQPGSGSFTIQAIITLPPILGDGFSHGIWSLAPSTNLSLIGTNGAAMIQSQGSIAFETYGTTLADANRWTVTGLADQYAGRRVKLTFVRDAGTNEVRTYINGYLQQATNTTSGVPPLWSQNLFGAQNLNLGGLQTSAVDNCFKGTFHRFTMWNTGLMGDEVMDLATYGMRPTGPQPVIDLDFSGAAGSGGTLDLSGRGQAGTTYGNPRFKGFYQSAGSSSSGGIPEAPNDGAPYMRQSLGWTNANARFSNYVPLAGGQMTGSLTNSQAGSPPLLVLERPGVSDTRFSHAAGVLTLDTAQGVLQLQNTNGLNLSKIARIQSGNYLGTGPSVAMIQSVNGSGNNDVDIGGNTSAAAATRIRLWVASALATAAGTEAVRILSGGMSLVNGLPFFYTAPTNTLGWITGFDLDPTGTTERRSKVTTLANLANQLSPLITSSGAPLNSPAFTGTPTVPTPPVRDESTTIPNTAWVVGVTGGKSGFRNWDDLLNPTALAGDCGAAGLVNGGTITFTATPETGRPGLRTLRTTAANQSPLFGWYSTGANPTFKGPSLGGADQYIFEAAVKTPAALAGGPADQYAIRVGFNVLSTTTNNPTDGIWLVHSTNFVGGTTWHFQCVSNSVAATAVDTGVSVAASTWYRLLVSVDGTQATASINGAVVANIAANGVPWGRSLNAVAKFDRYGGTTTMDAVVDWLAFDWKGAAR